MIIVVIVVVAIAININKVDNNGKHLLSTKHKEKRERKSIVVH